jgi:hypothetical protein
MNDLAVVNNDSAVEVVVLMRQRPDQDHEQNVSGAVHPRAWGVCTDIPTSQTIPQVSLFCSSLARTSHE